MQRLPRGHMQKHFVSARVKRTTVLSCWHNSLCFNVARRWDSRADYRRSDRQGGFRLIFHVQRSFLTELFFFWRDRINAEMQSGDDTSQGLSRPRLIPRGVCGCMWDFFFLFLHFLIYTLLLLSFLPLIFAAYVLNNMCGVAQSSTLSRFFSSLIVVNRLLNLPMN